jgi:SAM-dependent methyltransferase
MFDPESALKEWWRLLKSGGHLILVVPDEDLYEQGYWPSRFNSDHKFTFTIKNGKSWSPVSFNILNLVKALPRSKIISTEIQDLKYDYSLQTKFPPKKIKSIPIRYKVLRKILRKLPIVKKTLLRSLENKFFIDYHLPIDQTMREAVAQIQIVARKV